MYFEIIDKISKKYNEKIHIIKDVNDDFCIFLSNIDRVKKKKFLSNLEGRGKTIEDASQDYINKALDTTYRLRYKKEIYVTDPIRKIIKRKLKI